MDSENQQRYQTALELADFPSGICVTSFCGSSDMTNGSEDPNARIFLSCNSGSANGQSSSPEWLDHLQTLPC